MFPFGAVKNSSHYVVASLSKFNVSSNHLNWPYDSAQSLELGGRLFQTCGPYGGEGPVSKTAAHPTDY